MLTDTKIKSLKSKERQYKVGDSGGLFLLIHPNGSKYWRMKYKFADKEKTLAIGVYPAVTLQEARFKRDEAKRLLAQSIDPSQHKRQQKLAIKNAAANSFEAVSREWHDTMAPNWKGKHAKDVMNTLERDVFPFVGRKPIAEITPPELLYVLRKVEKRGALEVVRKLRQRCESIYKFAIVTGRATYNPARDLEGAFKKQVKTHFKSLKAKELPELMQAVNRYSGEITTKNGIKLILYTLLRTRELIGAEWAEIDYENGVWTIPAERMKMGREHLVPLSRQAIVCLQDLQEMTGHHKWVFASSQKPKHKHMSNNAMIYGLYRMGFHGRTTIHGLRSTGSTILHEMGFNPDVIEKTLSHERGGVRMVYNKAEYLDARADMLQQWADYLDNMDGKIIPINSKADKHI